MWAAKRARLYRVYVEYGLTPSQARAALDRREAREAEVREVVAREVTRPHSVPVMPRDFGGSVKVTPELWGRLTRPDEPLVRAAKVIKRARAEPPHWVSICDRVQDPLAPLRGGAGSAVR